MTQPTASTAKLFMSGRSQAVRLPKSLRFEGTEVIARRFGNGVLLLPAEAPWALMREALDEFEPGFELQREQPEQASREDLLVRAGAGVAAGELGGSLRHLLGRCSCSARSSAWAGCSIPRPTPSA